MRITLRDRLPPCRSVVVWASWYDDVLVCLCAVLSTTLSTMLSDYRMMSTMLSMMCPIPSQIEVDGWRGTRENRKYEIAEVTVGHFRAIRCCLRCCLLCCLQWCLLCSFFLFFFPVRIEVQWERMTDAEREAFDCFLSVSCDKASSMLSTTSILFLLVE